MKKYYHKFRKHITHHAHKAIKQKSTPHSIALSFAIGTFIAVFPTFFLGLFIVFGLMIFYKKLNKIAAIAGLAFWNFIMMIPVYYLSYNIGRLLFNSDTETTIRAGGYELIEVLKIRPFSFNNVFNFLKQNIILLQQYFIGNTILAILLSCLSYLVIKRAVVVYRENKEKKKLKLRKINKKLS